MGALLRIAVRPAIRLLIALFEAFAYRLRGGGFIQFGRTQPARACWAISFLVMVFAYAHAPWQAAYLATPVLAFLSLIATGHGEHQDLGRGKAGSSLDGKPYEIATWPIRALIKRSDDWPFWQRELFDAACMSWIGLLRGVIATAAIAPFDPSFAIRVIIGNALMGPAYWLGYRVPLTLPGLAARTTEWGELFTGFCIALPFLIRP